MEFTVYKSRGGQVVKEITMQIDDADYQTRDLGFVPDEFWTKRIKELSENRHAQLVIDMDQVYSAHGAVTEEERAALHDRVLNLPRPDLQISGEDPDPYGRVTNGVMKAYSWAPQEIQREMLFENEKVREHLKDLVREVGTFTPASCELQMNGVDLDLIIFDYPDVRSFPSEEDQARLDDVLDRLREQQKPQRIAITGCPSGAGIRGVMEKLCDEKDYVVVDFCDSILSDTWKAIEPEKELRIFKPDREWEQRKLRRGKGHNKFKRRGKK